MCFGAMDGGGRGGLIKTHDRVKHNVWILALGYLEKAGSYGAMSCALREEPPRLPTGSELRENCYIPDTMKSTFRKLE